MGYSGLQEMTGGYKELQRVTRGYIGLQRAYRELERVTGGTGNTE